MPYELSEDTKQLIISMKERLMKDMRDTEAKSHEQRLLEGTDKNFLLQALQEHCVFQTGMITGTRELSKFYLEMQGGMNIFYNDDYLKRHPMQATMLLFSVGKQLKVRSAIPELVAGVELRQDALG